MSEKNNTIGKDFSNKELIKFVAAPIISKLITSLLSTIDDGLFISRYCGEYALAAFSIAFPWFMVSDTVGMTLSAIGVKSSILLGEKKQKEANAVFTTMTIEMIVIGVLLFLIATFFGEEILVLLGADEVTLPYALQYMNISRLYIPAMLLNYIFIRYFTIAGKPKYNVITTVLQTVLNLIFDYIFIAKLDLGIVGAAYANLIGCFATVLVGLLFFANRKHEIHFTNPDNHYFKILKETIILGKAQGFTSVAIAVNAYICNAVQINYIGNVGVAALSVVNNIQFMFMNAFFGLLGSTSPIISYAYGEKNVDKLVKTIKQVVVIVTGLSFIIVAVFLLSRPLLIELYVQQNSNSGFREMITYGLKIAPFSFLVFGYNVMTQDMFISVANSKVSTILSIIENVLFANLAIILLPKVFGANSVWFAFLTGEICTFIFTLIAIIQNKDEYGYGKDKIANFLNK